MAKPLIPNGNRAKQRSSPVSAQPALIESGPDSERTSNRAKSSNRPLREFRHRNLRATIWKNDTEKGVMYNVTLSRTYRDGEKWADSQSFGLDDLMNLAKLLADAHTFITSSRESDFASSKAKRPSRPAARVASNEHEPPPF